MSVYLITGVGGDLGSRLLPLLSADSSTERIVGVDRSSLKVSAPKLEYVQRDIEDGEISDLLDGVDTIVHLAPSSHTALRSMLDCALTANIKSIVVPSSASVYGAWPTNSVPLTEDSPLRPNPGFRFALGLAEQERILQNWQAEHPEVAVAILRLAMILGGSLDRALIGALGGMTHHRHTDSSRPVQFLHVDDAVSALGFAAIERLQGTFNVAPDGFVSDSTARAIAGVAPRPGLPKRVAFLANDFAWRTRHRTDFVAVEPYLEHPWVMANDRMRAAGWQPTFSTEEAVVAESKPTWWGRMRPGQRRALVTGGIVAGSTAGIVGSVAVATEVLRRKRHS